MNGPRRKTGHFGLVRYICRPSERPLLIQHTESQLKYGEGRDWPKVVKMIDRSGDSLGRSLRVSEPNIGNSAELDSIIGMPE